MSQTFNPLDMPIIPLENATSDNTSRFEAPQLLDSPETISAFLNEIMKENDSQILMQALGEVAKARGVSQLGIRPAKSSRRIP